MNRRTFLKRGLLGGAILTLGSAAVLGLRSGKGGPGPKRELRVLDPAVFPVVVALAEVVIRQPKADPVEIAHSVDEVLSYAAPATSRDLNRVFGLLENGLAGALLRGSATCFTELDLDGRAAALDAWRSSRLALLRGAYQGMRKLVCIGFYTNLENTRAAGFPYPGPFFVKPPAPPITARGALSPPWRPTKTEEVPG